MSNDIDRLSLENARLKDMLRGSQQSLRVYAERWNRVKSFLDENLSKYWVTVGGEEWEKAFAHVYDLMDTLDGGQTHDQLTSYIDRIQKD